MTLEQPPLPLKADEDDLLYTAICRGTAALNDAQVLAALLQDSDPVRAEALLREAGSLDLIQRMGPLEMIALGLNENEIGRVMVATEFATRATCRERRRRLGTLEETVRELRLRAQSWPRSLIGLIGIDTCKRVILDKVLFEGTPQWTPMDLAEVLRETLRAGCAGIIVYRWAPVPEVVVSSEDRRTSDELRVMGSILGITLIDYLAIAENSFWSGRCDDEWAS